MSSTKYSTEFLSDFDEAAVETAINEAFAEEKNSAPRYNPFSLADADTDSVAAVLVRLKNQPSTNQLLTEASTKDSSTDGSAGS